MFSSIGKSYVQAYSGHSRGMWLLALMTFLNRAGSMVFPFLAVYSKTILGFSLMETGMIVSSMGVGGVIGSYLGGWLTDRVGAYGVITGSMFLGGISFISLQLSVQLWPLVALLFVCGMFTEAYRPAMMSMVGEMVEEQKVARSMALIRLAVNIGFGAGTAAGGFIAAGLGYVALFWIDGLTCILAGIFFIIAFANQRDPEGEIARTHAARKMGSTPPWMDKEYMLFCLGTLILGITFIQWFHTVPTYIKDDWLFDERYIGIMFTVNTLILTIIELPLIDRIESSGKVRQAMRTGIVLIGLSFLSFLLPPRAGLIYFAMVILTIGEVLFMPFNSSEAIIRADKRRRGEYMSYYSMTWSVTQVLGPVIGFTIAGELGYNTLFPVLCLMGISGLFFFRGVSRQESKAGRN